MLMALPALSQTTSKGLRAEIRSKDTVALIMHIEDARLMLADLLDYEIVDSLLTVYQEKDSINMLIINEKDVIIEAQSAQIDNYKLKSDNYEQIIRNKNTELGIMLAEIEELKKEVKKERNKKRFAIICAVAGPIVTAVGMMMILG